MVKLIRKSKGPRIAKILLKNNKEGTNSSRYQDLLLKVLVVTVVELLHEYRKRTDYRP